MHSLTERDHWLKLFSAMLDGSCDAAGEREAMRLLESQAAARRDFAELSQLHLWLSEDAGVHRVLDRADAPPDNIIAMPGAAMAQTATAASAGAAAETEPAVMAAPIVPAASRGRAKIAIAAAFVAASAALLPAGAWVLTRQLIAPVIPGTAPGEPSVAHWQPVDVERELRPALAKCAACHSAETAETAGGGVAWSFPPQQETTPSGRPLQMAGRPEESALWLRLNRSTGPDDPHACLTSIERNVIRRWIEQQA